MSTDTWVHVVALAIALVTLHFTQRSRADRTAAHQAKTDQRLTDLENQMKGLDNQFEAALARWELGFRDRLNGQYAKSLVSGVEASIIALRQSFEQFREDYRLVVRHEAADAIQKRIEDLEAVLWQKVKVTSS